MALDPRQPTVTLQMARELTTQPVLDPLGLDELNQYDQANEENAFNRNLPDFFRQMSQQIAAYNAESQAQQQELQARMEGATTPRDALSAEDGFEPTRSAMFRQEYGATPEQLIAEARQAEQQQAQQQQVADMAAQPQQPGGFAGEMAKVQEAKQKNKSVFGDFMGKVTGGLETALSPVGHAIEYGIEQTGRNIQKLPDWVPGDEKIGTAIENLPLAADKFKDTFGEEFKRKTGRDLNLRSATEAMVGAFEHYTTDYTIDPVLHSTLPEWAADPLEMGFDFAVSVLPYVALAHLAPPAAIALAADYGLNATADIERLTRAYQKGEIDGKTFGLGVGLSSLDIVPEVAPLLVRPAMRALGGRRAFNAALREVNEIKTATAGKSAVGVAEEVAARGKALPMEELDQAAVAAGEKRPAGRFVEPEQQAAMDEAAAVTTPAAAPATAVEPAAVAAPAPKGTPEPMLQRWAESGADSSGERKIGRTDVVLKPSDIPGHEDAVLLDWIGTKDLSQGRGSGSKALEEVIRMSDETGTPVVLQPEARGGSLNDAALTDWYARHGFEYVDEDVMRYEPNSRGAEGPLPRDESIDFFAEEDDGWDGLDDFESETDAEVQSMVAPTKEGEPDVIGERIAARQERERMIMENERTPVDEKMGRHRLTTPEGDRLDWRTTPEGAHIMDVTVQQEGRGTGTALLERAIADIRKDNPKATITADLNSEGGARLFARQSGAEFTDMQGNPMSTADAINAAARGEGPQASLRAGAVDPVREAVASFNEAPAPVQETLRGMGYEHMPSDPVTAARTHQELADLGGTDTVPALQAWAKKNGIEMPPTGVDSPFRVNGKLDFTRVKALLRDRLRASGKLNEMDGTERPLADEINARRAADLGNCAMKGAA